jgi:predicted nucleic acid-binding Zn ribbon protein
MRQKRRLLRSDRIARNLLWLLVLLILVCVVLMVRGCHA